VTKLGVKHQWGEGNQFCINEGDDSLGGPEGRCPIGEIRVYILKATPQERLTEYNQIWCKASRGEGQSILYK